MNLSNLQGLWLLSLLAPLILMYILKIRRQRQVISSTWLWQSAERDLKARHPWRKLRAQVPLLLQLAALVLLALAATRPLAPGSDPLVKHVAFVLDVSASMQARESDGRSRLDLAKRAVESRLQALDPSAEVMLLSAGKSAKVLTPFERDRRRVLRQLAELEAGDVEGSLLQAVSLGVARLRQLEGDRRLVIVTDGALADRRPILTSGVPTDIVRVGEPVENLGITRIDVQSEPPDQRSNPVRSGSAKLEPEASPDEDPTGDQPSSAPPPPSEFETSAVHVFASVKNYGKRVQNVHATLKMRNVPQPLSSRQVQLKPGEEAPVVLSFEAVPSDEGTGLIVELSPHDALPVDDVAFALVPLARKQPVVLAPPDKTPWLRRALLADPDVELLGISEEGLENTRIPEGALIVYAGHCPKRAPPSSYLIVNPPPGPCLTDLIEPAPEGHQITQWNESDPRLRFLSLGGLRVRSANRIATDSPQRTLAESQHGNIITKQDLFGRQGTLVSFDFGETDWPLKASFVLFVRNLVELARVQRQRVEHGAVETGQPLRLSVPLDVLTLSVIQANDSPVEIAAKNGIALLPTVERTGFYYFSWQGQTPGSVLLPANLASENESDLSLAELPELFSGDVRESNEAEPTITDWTWLLAALALAFVMFDVWYLTRERARGTLLSAASRKA